MTSENPLFNFGSRIVPLTKKEREVDIKHLSFPIQDFLAYFNSFGEYSEVMCEAIRTDPQARARFEQDAVDAEFTCKINDDDCFVDIDCCSGICQDNVCVSFL